MIMILVIIIVNINESSNDVNDKSNKKVTIIIISRTLIRVKNKNDTKNDTVRIKYKINDDKKTNQWTFKLSKFRWEERYRTSGNKLSTINSMNRIYFLCLLFEFARLSVIYR